MDPHAHPTPAAPERRQLTVMFCDLAGSTALSRQLDPEDLRAVIRRFQELVRGVVAGYEGFVSQYMGDGVLAYFGYPVAHEDDAARAIHAGLGIVEAIRTLAPPLLPKQPDGPPPVHIGISTGLVVVGDRFGVGASHEIAAIGEAPNLAARLQAAAETGSVVIAERTLQLAGGRFEYAAPLHLELKGYGGRVPAWRVVGTSRQRSRFELTHPGDLTPWVGRETELERLLARWRASAAGEGGVVLLTGEAGIGKSRLVKELVLRIGDMPFYRLAYQCSPYHTHSALHPFIRQLENAAHFAPGESVASRLDKLEALLAAASPALAQATGLFAELLSLPTEGRYPALPSTPQQRKVHTLQAMLGRLQELAASRPVLMVLEDAHWIDPTSSELLDLLATRVADMPVLIVVTTRGGTDPARLELPRASVLTLERLTPAESAELAGRVATRSPLGDDALAQIVSRADGVPLFAEELVQAVVAGLATRDIPSTLQDLLMARLDRLGAAKEVAQVAAAVGREVSRRLLAALLPMEERELDEALETLAAAAVMLPATSLPTSLATPPLAPLLSFRHALLHDAAYASLLLSRRRELHGTIAEALERLEPERLRSEPELLSHHHAQAGHALQAARYSGAAALRALERSANLEALRHATHGIELLGGVAEGAERERAELSLTMLAGAAHRAVHGFASHEAEQCFARALALSEQLGDVPSAIDVRRGLFSCHYARGELALARAQGRHVADVGEQRGDRAAHMLGQWMLGVMSMWQGNFRGACDELALALELYVPDEHRSKTLAAQIDPGVNAMSHLAWVHWILGDADAAMQTAERAMQAARDLGQPFALAMALFFGCVVRGCRGEFEAAEPLLSELTAVTGEHRLSFLGTCAHVLRGQALIDDGACEEGLRELDVALHEFDAQEAGLGRPWALAIAASGWQRLGMREQGLRAIDAAFAAVERHGERHWEAELWRVKGELLAPSPQARDCLQRAIEVARHQSARSLEQRASETLARLHEQEGAT
jgi:class 3 adenylate cyclase/tetratricopeptide (TPR) repeat protein